MPAEAAEIQANVVEQELRTRQHSEQPLFRLSEPGIAASVARGYGHKVNVVQILNYPVRHSVAGTLSAPP